MPLRLIATLTAWLCLCSMAFAEELKIIRTDTSGWPMTRVVIATQESGASADEYTLTLPSGKKIPASSITELPDKPLSANMVVALDTSRSLSPDHLKAAKNSLTKYVDRLESNEQLSLLSFNDNVELVIGFTSDRDAFKSTLSRLKLGGQHTELYRAMLYGIENIKNIPGQRTLLVITDGKDEGSVVTRAQVIQAAKDNGVRLLAIGLPGLPGNESEAYLPQLKQMADETGGIFRMARSAQELGEATYTLMVENQGMSTHIYELGFGLAEAAPLPSGHMQAGLSRSHDGVLQTTNVNFDTPDTPALSRTALSSRMADEKNSIYPGETAAEALTTAQLQEREATKAPAVKSTDTPTGPFMAENTATVQNSTRNAVEEQKIDKAASIWPWLIAALFFLLLLWLYMRRKNPAPVTAAGTATGEEPLLIEFPHAGLRFPLKPGTMVMGSNPASDIRIDSPDIKDTHLEFCTGAECSLKNLAGSQGVLLNGKAVEQTARLKPGDVLTIGSTRAVIKRQSE